MVFQQNQRCLIKYNCIFMSEGQISKIKGLHSFLDQQREFSHIDIIQNQINKTKKPLREKIRNKISPTLTLKDLGNNNKKLGSGNLTLRSQMHKKSRAVDKQGGKKIKSDKQSSQKNFESRGRKCSKTLYIKPKENIKSIKSIKKVVNKKQPKWTKIQINNQKKIKGNMDFSQGSDEYLIKMYKIKNQNELKDKHFAQKKRHFKQQNVIHDYFGSQNKLSSILDEKIKIKKNKGNMSKCKTNSSSNISIKAGHRLVSKALNKKNK